MSKKYLFPEDRTMAIFSVAILAASVGLLIGIYTGKNDAKKIAQEWCEVWREPTDADYVKPYYNDVLF